MPTFIVTRKTDGAEMTRYCAGEVTEQINADSYPLADFDHVEFVEGYVPAQSNPRILTKREFIKRFSVGEYSGIKAAAQVNATLDYYWQMFMLAEEISTGDPDTIAGVTMLEQAGLIGAGRAVEILHGE